MSRSKSKEAKKKELEIARSMAAATAKSKPNRDRTPLPRRRKAKATEAEADPEKKASEKPEKKEDEKEKASEKPDTKEEKKESARPTKMLRPTQEAEEIRLQEEALPNAERTGEDEANVYEDRWLKELIGAESSDDDPEPMSTMLTEMQKAALVEVANKESWVCCSLKNVSQRLLHLWLDPKSEDPYVNAWRREEIWHAWYWTKNQVKTMV